MLKVKKNIKENQELFAACELEFNANLGTQGIVFDTDWFSETGWAKMALDNDKALVGTYVGRFCGWLRDVSKKIAEDEFTKTFFLNVLTARKIQILPAVELPSKYQFSFENGALVLRWKVSMIAYSADNFMSDIAKAMNPIGFKAQKSLNDNKQIYKTSKAAIKQACGVKLKVDKMAFMMHQSIKQDLKDGLGIYLYQRYCPIIEKDMLKLAADADALEAIQEQIHKIVVNPNGVSSKQEFELQGDTVFIKVKADMLAFSFDAGRLEKFLMDNL